MDEITSEFLTEVNDIRRRAGMRPYSDGELQVMALLEAITEPPKTVEEADKQIQAAMRALKLARKLPFDQAVKHEERIMDNLEQLRAMKKELEQREMRPEPEPEKPEKAFGGMFRGTRKRWAIAGAIQLSKRLGFDIEKLGNTAIFFQMGSKMIDEIGASTQSEIASMFIIGIIDHIRDPRHLVQLKQFADEAREMEGKYHMSDKFYYNFVNQIAQRFETLSG